MSTRGKFGRGVGLGNAIVGQFNRAYKRPTPAVTEKNQSSAIRRQLASDIAIHCMHYEFAYSKYGGSCTSGPLFPYSWGYWVVLYACIKHNDNRIWGMLMHAYYSDWLSAIVMWYIVDNTMLIHRTAFSTVDLYLVCQHQVFRLWNLNVLKNNFLLITVCIYFSVDFILNCTCNLLFLMRPVLINKTL